ncbi:MAG: class I SAM-dependent rRNA methyltransferase [Candidatus Sericytochromatia bacterium]
MSLPIPGLVLKPGREKSIRNRHPWVFSGALADESPADLLPGSVVPLYSARQEILGHGFYNPLSQIRLRLFSFDATPIDRDFWKARLQRTLVFRQQLIQGTDAIRLVHGDADGLPGLVVDQYADALVLQFTSLGMTQIKPLIVELLQELLRPRLMVERSESPSLKEEGLGQSRGILAGEGATQVVVNEHGVLMEIDLLVGQKTGFFIDQRDSRRLIGQLAAGKKLLNCFSYTGGFSLHAAHAGATTTSVEISAGAQAQAQANFQLNGFDPAEHQFVTADVFDYLRTIGPDYDMIILDPPAFVKQRKHLKQACRAYQDINRIAMRQSRPDGLLLTCSCSHYLDWELFQKIIFAAAIEAGREVQILQRLGQPMDHPVSVFHPEGEYLKAFLLRVL